MARSTIALAMMVYNEAQYLPRIAENLNRRIEGVMIHSDPPDKDGSLVLAKELFNGLPKGVHIVERPWPETSAMARNAVIQHAKDYFKCDHVLWLDPDTPLLGRIPMNLTHAYYSCDTWEPCKQVNANRFEFTQFIRHDAPFEWRGRVHEFLDHDIRLGEKRLTTCWLERTGSGGGIDRIRDKDIPLLLQDIEREPDNSRHVFYLAQSYRAIGDYEKARKYYTKRLGMPGGFIEEEYYALYMLGVCSRALNLNGDAELWLLRAHNFRPSRREALRELINLYASIGSTALAAHLFGHVYVNIPPSKDLLFVDDGPR